MKQAHLAVPSCEYITYVSVDEENVTIVSNSKVGFKIDSSWVDSLINSYLAGSWFIEQIFDLQHAMVRMEAVTALLRLYSEEANLAQLHEITVRFQTRFTELPNDIEEEVAVKGVSPHKRCLAGRLLLR